MAPGASRANASAVLAFGIMPASWNELVDSMLQPARPLLSQCRARAEAHGISERRASQRRDRELADCQKRIETARAAIFKAGDGVVGARMTALEREWLAHQRAERSPEERALELWNEMAPRRWAGRLRSPFTGDPTADLEAAVMLASDPEGVERAESCGLRLAAALSTWGFEVRAAVRWRVASDPVIETRAEQLLAGPLSALTAALTSTYGAEALVARAHRIERAVLDAAAGSALLSSREALVTDLALVARVDFLWSACSVEARRVPADHLNAGRAFGELENPAAALLDLWKTGYLLAALEGDGVALASVPIQPANG